MDVLTAEVTRLAIVTPTVAFQGEPINCTGEFITQLINGVLQKAKLETWTDLKSTILPMVTAFCERWAIPLRAADNFVKLASGNPHFPVILLQNPSARHDQTDFEEMLVGCPTLDWLDKILSRQGLSLEHDIIVLDVCPLLSGIWLSGKDDLVKKNSDQRGVWNN